MSVLERLHRILGSATVFPRPDGVLVFPPPPTAHSGPDGGGWPWSRDPAVDRRAPSVRPGPAVAATASLVTAGQDSSPDPAGALPCHPRFSPSPSRPVGSPSQPVDSEQVSRWETDGGRTRELT
jgi:hypothetical protein